MGETVDRVKNGKIYVKPFNYICGLACIGLGVWAYFSDPAGNLYYFLAPFYIAIYGLIMIASDCNFSIVVNNMTFLDIYAGRGFFNVFVGSQVVNQAEISDDDGFNVVGKVFGWCIMGLGIYLLILHCLEKNTSINGIVRTQMAKSILEGSGPVV